MNRPQRRSLWVALFLGFHCLMAGTGSLAVAIPNELGFTLTDITFSGGEDLPSAGLEDIWRPFIGQWMTLSDLEALRFRLTQHYVDQGYINSGVVFEPDQDLRDGVLALRIVSGRLSAIRVTGQGRLRPGYLSKRLSRGDTEPFNRDQLQERFRLLLDDPLIDQLNGGLRPGTKPGSAVLDLDVTRARPWELYLRTDNNRPPSTGAERLYLGGALHNPAGFGDRLDAYLGIGYQGHGHEGSLSYSIPLNAADTRAFVRLERSDASLIEQPLDELDIESETTRAAVGLRHPLLRDLSRRLELGLQFNWGRNETTLLGLPFSFSEGSVDGESTVSALRFSQDYSQRDPHQAYALHSVLSLGVDAFDATVHEDGTPDSEFISWLIQGQYVRKLNTHGTQLIARGAAQFASERLLALEQFAVGGLNSVRGYRENEQVGDNGYTATLELRHPLWSKQTGNTRHQLQLALFTDLGAAWNHGRYTDHQQLISAGAGLVWSTETHLRAELYIAHRFEEPLPRAEYDLQDDGLHFLIQLDL